MNAPVRKIAPYIFYGQTTSLCETCLALVPAKIIIEEGKCLLSQALPYPRGAEDARLDGSCLLQTVPRLFEAR